MKVIVLGAGQVGSNIARYLAGENNDVTVVDNNPALIQRLSDTLDVKAMVGFGSHPNILEAAGAQDADMLVAVTLYDEVNMVACQIGHSIFEIPTKIARVRARSYLNPLWANLFRREGIPIDVVISPEYEVAHAISRRMTVPGAFDMMSLAEERVKVVGVRCEPECPVLYTPIRELAVLFPDLAMQVVAIVRNDQGLVPRDDEQILPGDEVYIVVDTQHLARAMTVFGHEEPEARRILIVGGGNIGQFLASSLEETFRGLRTRLIESDHGRAMTVAQSLERTPVLEGDGLDPEVLEEANITKVETVVAVTNDDKTNILASLLAKRYGAQRAISLVNQATYSSLVTSLGVDAVVNPRAITVSRILENVRRGRIKAVHSLRDGFAEIIEAEALETSTIVNQPLRRVRLPAGCRVGAVVRGNEVLAAQADTVVKPHDRVVLLAQAGSVRKVEKLFAVRLEFF